MGHNFVNNRTKICRCCGGCTGFGHECVILRREALDPGEDCKCGVGDSGCINCGYCKSCAKNEECSHISDIMSDDDSIKSEDTETLKGDLKVGTKVVVQWRVLGWARYPGHISQASFSINLICTKRCLFIHNSSV